MTNDLVERLGKQSEIMRGSKGIGLITKERSAVAMDDAITALTAANALAGTLRLYVENEKMIHRKDAAGLLEDYRVALGGEG